MKDSITTNRMALVSLVLLQGLPATAFASNWMRSEDELYFKAGVTYDRASERWNRASELVDISCTATNWQHNQSYEYGWSYYRTIFGSFDYLNRHCGDVTSAGLGDISLGMRGRLDIYRNGRTWEMAVIIPSGHRSYGDSSLGSGLYGIRLGLFGSFGDRRAAGNDIGTNYELGANLYIWEGAAPEQFASYAKFNFAPSQERHFSASLEGDYALVDRNRVFDSAINQVESYGYDRINMRLGYSQKATLYWNMSIEATTVLTGRNVSKSSGINLSFSRSFKD